MGRFEESIAEGKRAQELDPVSHQPDTWVGLLFRTSVRSGH